jgi:cell division protein ZipA
MPVEKRTGETAETPGTSATAAVAPSGIGEKPSWFCTISAAVTEEAVLALKRIGLVHGKYGIFHRLPDDGSDDPVFSVASLTEPGSFDLAKLQGMVIPGLSLFLTLPGPGDGVARFDRMIETARDLAEDLDGVVLDERGSSWSIQRERYIREEIIQFQHQFGRN